MAVYGLTRGDWLAGFLGGLTLAMAILPNEFPAVLAIFLALGAWRLSRHQALARRVPGLETLGAATFQSKDRPRCLTRMPYSIEILTGGAQFFMAITVAFPRTQRRGLAAPESTAHVSVGRGPRRIFPFPRAAKPSQFPGRIVPPPTMRWRMSTSLAFSFVAFSWPTRSRIFWPDDRASSWGSSNT